MSALRKTILIVEDNKINMRLFHDVLEAQGYNVLQARDGTEGWRMALEHCPDLILMDIHLPGITGLEVTKKLKADARLKSIPVIAVTAFAMSDDRKMLLDGGCDAYISKPISLPVFLQTIERFVEPVVAELEAE